MAEHFFEPFCLTTAQPSDVSAIAALINEHAEDKVLLRPRPLIDAALAERRAWKIVDDRGQLVAGTFMFPLTESLDEVFPLSAPARERIAAYEMAHMTVHPQARGLDFGVVLHGLRVVFMIHERITAPPLWLVMSHNLRSVRLIGQMGVERVASIPPLLLKGLWSRAEKVLAFRGLTTPPATLDAVVTTMALPSHGLNRLLRETAGALALLGPRCVVDPSLAGWFGLEPLRRVRGLGDSLPWSRAPLYEALWRAADD